MFLNVFQERKQLETENFVFIYGGIFFYQYEHQRTKKILLLLRKAQIEGDELKRYLKAKREAQED